MVESLGRCSHRAGRVTWQGLIRGTPLDHRCGRVAKLALERRRVQWHCPRAPTPEPGKGHRPKNRHSSKAKRVSALVSCLFPVLACLCQGFPGSGSLVFSGPAPSGSSLFFFVPPHVSFYWPRASRSSSRREGRRVKRRGTDPRTGTGRRPKDRLFQVPSMYDFLAYLVVPDLSFPLHFAMYFPRMLWALQWLSSTPAAPYSVVQDKSSSPLTIFVALLEKHRLQGQHFPKRHEQRRLHPQRVIRRMSYRRRHGRVPRACRAYDTIPRILKSVSRHFHRHWIHARTSDHGVKVMIAPICFLVVSRSFARVCSARASVFAALLGAPVGTCTASFCGALS